MIRMMINDGDDNDGDHNDKDYDHTNNVDYDHYHKEDASVGTQSHLASREARVCGIVAMIVIAKQTTTRVEIKKSKNKIFDKSYL